MALPTREVTGDEVERQFATNYLGPFALTGLLLPSIRRVAGSRVVRVSSSASKQSKIEFDNLQSERVYKPMFQAYAQSKLADLFFSLELQRRLKAAGPPIVSTAAHPGYVVTSLQADHVRPGLKILMATMKPFLSQDAAHGALPTLYAAVAAEAVAGGYYGPDGGAEPKGYPTAAPVPKSALDGTIAKRLWVESERLTRLKFGALSDAA